MRISDWSSDVCSSDLHRKEYLQHLNHELHRSEIIVEQHHLEQWWLGHLWPGFFDRQTVVAFRVRGHIVIHCILLNATIWVSGPASQEQPPSDPPPSTHQSIACAHARSWP